MKGEKERRLVEAAIKQHIKLSVTTTCPHCTVHVTMTGVEEASFAAAAAIERLDHHKDREG